MMNKDEAIASLSLSWSALGVIQNLNAVQVRLRSNRNLKPDLGNSLDIELLLR